MNIVAIGLLGGITVDVGPVMGILWVLGQVFLVLLFAYIVGRLAVKHALRAFYSSEQAKIDEVVHPAE